MFVKGWSRHRKMELRILRELAVGLADFLQDGGFGFHGDFELGKIGEGRKEGAAALF